MITILILPVCRTFVLFKVHFVNSIPLFNILNKRVEHKNIDVSLSRNNPRKARSIINRTRRGNPSLSLKLLLSHKFFFWTLTYTWSWIYHPKAGDHFKKKKLWFFFIRVERLEFKPGLYGHYSWNIGQLPSFSASVSSFLQSLFCICTSQSFKVFKTILV